MLFGEKILYLKQNQTKVSIPHLNVKGIVKNINVDKIEIELSDSAKEFLETDTIIISKDDLSIDENQKVFVKFNDIDIEFNELKYDSVELYKLIDNIEMSKESKDFFECDNDYGGKMKVEGVTFEYNNNTYFKCDEQLSENNELYYINVKNNILLIEEIRTTIFPYKIYNMVNPQETRFSEIVEIYKNK